VSLERPIHAIRFPIRIDAARGQVATETSHDAYVAQLIRQVLLTSPGERVHRPDFGAGLRRMVFAPNDDATAALIKATVYQALQRWLGDIISVDDVKTASTEAQLSIDVHYTLRARGDKRVLNIEVPQ